MEDATDSLNVKKEELVEEAKQGDIRNEDLKKELAAKEEISAKRL